MDKSIIFLDSILNNDDTVIIACSAGPDSMALLHVLIHLNKKINVICAHVNHKVRKQSDKEYQYLKQYCLDNNIFFEGMEIAHKIPNNFESEARRIRYSFFKSLKAKYHAKYIITAHHGDDLVETILMRITRGSNLSGYAGIKLIDNDYLHPFLYVDKKDILNYLKSNHIKYFIDKTNNKNEHTRNRYRHHVLSFLKKENPIVHLKYLAYSKKLLEYDKFIDNYVNDNKFINKNIIDIEKVKKQPDIIIKKCLEKIIVDIQKKDLFDVSDQNIEDMLKMIKSSKSNSTINLNNGYISVRDYDSFYIKKDINANKFNTEFIDFYEDDNWLIKLVKKTDDDSNNVIRLDSKSIKMPLIIRSRIKGDKMQVKNLGTKKVKDIFIDEKISLHERDSWPIICDNNNNILLIPGLKKSKFAKDKTEKYDIILLCERKDFNEECQKK